MTGTIDEGKARRRVPHPDWWLKRTGTKPTHMK
jgi:hypothetical protein